MVSILIHLAIGATIAGHAATADPASLANGFAHALVEDNLRALHAPSDGPAGTSFVTAINVHDLGRLRGHVRRLGHHLVDGRCEE